MRTFSFVGALGVGFGVMVSGAGAALTPVAVGSGDATSHVVVNFADGAVYRFDVSYPSAAAPNGLGLMRLIRDGAGAVLVEQDFGFGVFIDGVTYDGHSNVGFGGGENWWHYWVRPNDATNWVSPDFGAASNVAQNGSWDGWVYGNAGAPIPEPAAGGVAALAAVALGARRRRSAAAVEPSMN